MRGIWKRVSSIGLVLVLVVTMFMGFPLVSAPPSHPCEPWPQCKDGGEEPPADPAIAFVGKKKVHGDTVDVVMVMNADGSNQAVIYEGYFSITGRPSWSPDGQTIWAGTDRGLVSFLPFDNGGEEPEEGELGAYPNPFRHGCADGIRLVGAGGQVSGVVVDIAGRLIARFERRKPEDLVWDGRKDGRAVAPGLYILQLRTPRGTETVGVAVLETDCGP